MSGYFETKGQGSLKRWRLSGGGSLKKMKCGDIVALLIPMLFLSQVSRADSWAFPVGETIKPFKAGSLNCKERQIVTNGERGNYPTYSFSCEDNGKLLFSKSGIGADKVFSSKSGNFILGLSEKGFHEFAFWILDRKGNVLASESHNGKKINYCMRSITIARKWLHENPNPIFYEENGKLNDLSVVSCKSGAISLKNIQPFQQK